MTEGSLIVVGFKPSLIKVETVWGVREARSRLVSVQQRRWMLAFRPRQITLGHESSILSGAMASRVRAKTLKGLLVLEASVVPPVTRRRHISTGKVS